MAVALRAAPWPEADLEIRRLWAEVQQADGPGGRPAEIDRVRRQARFYLTRLAMVAPATASSAEARALAAWLGQATAPAPLAAQSAPRAIAPAPPAQVRTSRPTVLVTVVAAVLLLVPCLALLRGYKAMVVLSGSMEPTIPTGALILVEPIPADQVRVGDVLTFPHPTRQTENVTHRVVAVDQGPTGRFFRTQGDANGTPDSWRVPSTGTLGRHVASIPRLGFAFRAASDPIGRMALMVLPSLVLGAMSLLNVWQRCPEPRA